MGYLFQFRYIRAAVNTVLLNTNLLILSNPLEQDLVEQIQPGAVELRFHAELLEHVLVEHLGVRAQDRDDIQHGLSLVLDLRGVHRARVVGLRVRAEQLPRVLVGVA